MAQLDEKVRAFLQETRFAVLATINDDGTPQQTVMWYDLDGDEILMNTAAGRVKAHNLRRNPKISLCFEDGYRYVTLVGTVQLIEDQETAQADIARLAKRYGSDDISGYMKQTRVTLRMPIERVVTRF